MTPVQEPSKKPLPSSQNGYEIANCRNNLPNGNPMKLMNRAMALAFLVPLSVSLNACGSDEPESSSSSTIEQAGGEEAGPAGLPDELDCVDFGSVDLRPILETVTDSSDSPSTCSWSGLIPDDNTTSPVISFRLEDGLPSDFTALKNLIGEDGAEFGQLEEVPPAAGWSYGFQIPVGTNDFNDGSSVMAFYLVDSAGKGASCSFGPSYPEDVFADDRAVYMSERVEPLSKICADLLSDAQP